MWRCGTEIVIEASGAKKEVHNLAMQFRGTVWPALYDGVWLWNSECGLTATRTIRGPHFLWAHVCARFKAAGAVRREVDILLVGDEVFDTIISPIEPLEALIGMAGRVVDVIYSLPAVWKIIVDHTRRAISHGKALCIL